MTLVVSLLAPFLGAMADYPGANDAGRTGLPGQYHDDDSGALSPNAWQWLLIIYVLSAIGYSGGNLFYDSFLTDVADYRQIDALSATGTAWGYLGGLAFLLIFLTKRELVAVLAGLTDCRTARFSFILAGLWWIIFGLPFLKNAHQRYSVPKEQKPIVASFARVIKTMRHIRQYRAAFWFLIAYFFYIDGVDTIFTMATSIGSDMGIDTTRWISFISRSS